MNRIPNISRTSYSAVVALSCALACGANDGSDPQEQLPGAGMDPAVPTDPGAQTPDGMTPDGSPAGPGEGMPMPSSPVPPPPVPEAGPGPMLPEGTNVGRGVIRRLTAIEYNNTVRDLVGSEAGRADLFPSDAGGEGFQNFSGTQTISPSHVEAYERAAERLVEATFADAARKALVLSCDIATGEACIRSTLDAFLPKAWRRPVSEAEVTRLMTLGQAAAGGAAEEQLKLALRGALSSPHFFFLVERDADPNAATPHRLNNYELASRLSYFLWSTMPDDALFTAAAAETPFDDATLSAEVERMLASPKARTLIDVFATQWLKLDEPLGHYPHNDKWPAFTEKHRLSMTQEGKLFVEEMLFQGGSISDLVSANHTYIDGTLAAWYGLPAPAGGEFAKTSLEGSNRIGGLIGQGGFLMHTSGALDPSAVKRGIWILDNILCSPLPPPPPGVDTTLKEPMGELTARNELAQHSSNPSCSGCHSRIDPLGLALENYDAVGQFRTEDKRYLWPGDREKTPGVTIDPAGTLPPMPGAAEGVAFSTPAEMIQLLAEDDRTRACVGHKVFTFALGRAPTGDDQAYTDALSASNGDLVLDVLKNLVVSEAFRSRRGQSPDEPSLGGGAEEDEL